MDCDLASLAAYLWAPAEPGPVWLVPGLLPSVPARSGGSSEASPGARWCFGGCRRQLSLPVPEPSPGFPRPCQVQAAGHRGASLQQRSARHPLAVPAPARGSSSSSSALPNLPQSANMATETEWSCPICRDARDDVSYAMPCRHQFCLGCILRWTEVKPECPLCRRPVENVRFSVLGEDDYLHCAVQHREDRTDASSQAGSAPGPLPENSPHHPAVSPPSSPQGIPSPAEQGAAGPEAVGGLLPEVWAELFQRQQHLLDPVLPWLRQELEAIFGPWWWEARSAESSILHALCIYGPDAEVMVRMLRPVLEEYTASLVHGTINTVVRQCSEEAQRLLRSHGAGEEDNSPADSSSSASSSSASSSCTGSQEGTPTPHPSSSSSPSGAEQEQPQEEPGQEAAAGASAQGCSRSPSAPGRGRDRSPGGRRRPAKRRAPGPQDSPRPCKRPPRRRH
ncbi:E3 ubiquitin-protein ligase Topors-like [Haliaeetus albicilla]|uniref:E3 ubiquitin-protein ligase Topors-like n=1 Tax=Haliaeetus albicilla TaxID=8969 RepID=UPI0037E9957F